MQQILYRRGSTRQLPTAIRQKHMSFAHQEIFLNPERSKERLDPAFHSATDQSRRPLATTRPERRQIHSAAPLYQSLSINIALYLKNQSEAIYISLVRLLSSYNQQIITDRVQLQCSSNNIKKQCSLAPWQTGLAYDAISSGI